MDAGESVEDGMVDTDVPHHANDSVPKHPLTFKDVIGSVFDFTNFTKNCLKKDKLTKADLEGPAFKLIKGRHRNYIKLEYNFKQCYLALTNQLDWVNPEGNRIPNDLSNPLPLQGPPGHLKIPVDFFFNKDLEYLTGGNTERRYSTSLTKPKATRYDLEGIKKMITPLWSSTKVAYENNAAFGISHWGTKGNYSLEQGKQDNPVIITILKKRVEDVQLKVEIYQIKLNITCPQIRCDGLDAKEPYTIFHKPRGVVYLNKDDKKYLMRADELYKFRDGTLKKVCDKLDFMLHNFMLVYNDGMPRRAWIDKDQERTTSVLEKIEKTLLTRRIIRSIECYVGGKNIETDYKLLTRIGEMPTKIELALEQSQQSASDDVLNIRVILFSIHSDNGNPSGVNIKQHYGRYNIYTVKRGTGGQPKIDEMTKTSSSISVDH
ncbi:hypothetical protein Tco_1234951 [Tanacetum coccineum]